MPSADISPQQSTYVQNSYYGETSFANMRNDTSGYSVDTTPDNTYYTIGILRGNILGTSVYSHKSIMMDFDLSAIPSGATITAVTLKVKGATMQNLGGGYVSYTAQNCDAIILKGNFDSSIDTNDIDAFTGFTGGWGASDVTEYSSNWGPAAGGWSTSDFNSISLNSDGVSDANNAFVAGARLKFYIGDYAHWYGNDDSFHNADLKQTRMNGHFDLGNSDSPFITVTYTEAVSGPVQEFKISSGTLSVKSGTLTIK